MKNTIHIKEAKETEAIILPDDLGFGRIFTDRMFTQEYNEESGWHGACISSYAPISLDPAATVYHNGQMVFDGTKAYRRRDGNINLFRPELNVERFNLSASRMGMPSVDAAIHLKAIKTLIELEHRWVPQMPGTSLYIRPTMISTEKTLEVRAGKEYLHFIILTPVAPYFATGFSPVSVYVSDDYVRTVRGGTGQAKTPGNYAGSIVATEIALQKGYQQVLWLDGVERKYIDEVGAMNIAFVLNGKEIVTPSLTGAILHGVTRRSLLELAPDLGYKITERKIEIKEIIEGLKDGTVTEIFGMGTGAVIAPVGKINYKNQPITIRDGCSGPIATHLYNELTDIQYGRKNDPYNWTQTISVGPQ